MMKKSTRFNLIIALAYCLILAGAVYLIQKLLINDEQYNFSLADSSLVEVKKAEDIAHIIKKKYVDEVNMDSLQYLPIDSMLHQLDPHSAYLPAPDANSQSDELEGSFEGVGVEYYFLNDTLLVTNVVKDGPAYRAGLKQGDKILKIDTLNVSGRGLPQSAITGRIKGKKGTSVQLMVSRPNLPNKLLITIRRNKINQSSIVSCYMLSTDIGYIKISRFGAKTETDFISALSSLKSKGMKKLIIDLRDNGGGLLNAATALASQVLPEHKLIVYTQGRHEPRTDYFASGGGEFENGKLVVLQNENTASASEIFSGAIQDNKRGLIIGRRSFGKGLVQEQFAFEDGSAVNLTIARYYTPNGRSIQKPYNKGFEAYQHEVENRFNSGELTTDEEINDSLYTNSKALKKDHKKISAFGGIQPDIYVKLDTVGYNSFFGYLLKNRYLSDYVFDILADRYNSEYLTASINNFVISDKDYVDFLKYLQWRKVTIDNKQLFNAKPLIYKNLKLLLYKYYLGDEGFYRVQNQDDLMIKQAIKSLNK